MLRIHPADSNLLFDIEDGEITAVAYENNDVTEFVVEYADYLFLKWEKEIN